VNLIKKLKVSPFALHYEFSNLPLLQKETREEALARIALGLAKTAERRRMRGLSHPTDLVWNALLFSS
jgi:hypothetical protein